MIRMLVLSSLLLACITAPDVVLVDQASVLERQAAGAPAAEMAALDRHALSPAPVALTSAQLEKAGWGLGQGPVAQAVALYGYVPDETELQRRLLVQGCLGEGLQGQLQLLESGCAQAERDEAAALVIRVNAGRDRLFLWLARDGAKGVQQVWRARHVQGLPCGALIETPAGWTKKAC